MSTASPVSFESVLIKEQKRVTKGLTGGARAKAIHDLWGTVPQRLRAALNQCRTIDQLKSLGVLIACSNNGDVTVKYQGQDYVLTGSGANVIYSDKQTGEVYIPALQVSAAAVAQCDPSALAETSAKHCALIITLYNPTKAVALTAPPPSSDGTPAPMGPPAPQRGAGDQPAVPPDTRLPEQRLKDATTNLAKVRDQLWDLEKQVKDLAAKIDKLSRQHWKREYLLDSADMTGYPDGAKQRVEYNQEIRRTLGLRGESDPLNANPNEGPAVLTYADVEKRIETAQLRDRALYGKPGPVGEKEDGYVQTREALRTKRIEYENALSEYQKAYKALAGTDPGLAKAIAGI